MPVVRLVERLDDRDVLAEELDDLAEVLRVGANPRVVHRLGGRGIAELIFRVLLDRLRADQAVDLQTLAAQTVDDLAVGLRSIADRRGRQRRAR